MHKIFGKHSYNTVADLIFGAFTVQRMAFAPLNTLHYSHEVKFLVKTS